LIPHPCIFSPWRDFISQREHTLVSEWHLFCKKSKALENLPPTQNALLQHAKRAISFNLGNESGYYPECPNTGRLGMDEAR
jgi:hypothetical protein